MTGRRVGGAVERARKMRFDVFGRELVVERSAGGWTVFHAAADGKRRLADGILVPPDVPPDGLESYLADLCHEWASPGRTEVRRLAWPEGAEKYSEGAARSCASGTAPRREPAAAGREQSKHE